MKRFYKTATTIEKDGKWAVALDGRIIKTPARSDLTVSDDAIAAAIAEEWNAQGETVDIPAMHLTRLINVAIDRTPGERQAMIDEVGRYCETDLLCFLADDDQEDLRNRQIDLWRPIREWAGKTLGIVLLEAPGGVLHQPQPPASIYAARAHLSPMDDLRLTAFVFGMGLYGSALLMFAVERGHIEPLEAYESSILDEAWQMEKWGEDAEARARHDAQRTEVSVLTKVFSLKNAN
ncbi:MAG: ATP12 family protein [Pseudomonadota bacterium]